MEISAVNFSYDSKAISKEAFESHMILYRGYVSKINDISRAIASGESAGPFAYRGMMTDETLSLNGVILHEEYFRGMSAEKSEPGEKTALIINRFFGAYDDFLSAFKECANAARGWGVLAYDQRTKSARIFLQDAHDAGVVTTAYPLLVIDVYEHAYYLDYKTDKKKYVDAFMDGINWRTVEKRAAKLDIV